MLGRPPPRGKTWVAPYIDDLASTHIAPKHEIVKGAFARDTAIMDKADIICSKAGLLEKAEKRNRNMVDGKAWGTVIENSTKDKENTEDL